MKRGESAQIAANCPPQRTGKSCAGKRTVFQTCAQGRPRTDKRKRLRESGTNAQDIKKVREIKRGLYLRPGERMLKRKDEGRQMKENKYDQQDFFQKYSQMDRSKYGLKGAGEWSAFQKLLPAFEGKRVLDLGCGYGWHCMYAAQQGAKSVKGIDLSEKMLAVARHKNSHPAIAYERGAMEDLAFASDSFDVVISSLAFHYVRDFDDLARKISAWICPGGSFVFSVEHPVFTAYGTQEWIYDEAGNIKYFPVDNYFLEGRRDAVFLGEKVIKYHRTLTTYLAALKDNGFEICQLVEPQPPAEMLAIPGMKEELRRPMMLLVAARKKEDWTQRSV